MQGKLNEIYNQCEKTRKEFRNGQTSADEFVQKYLKQKIEYYENDQVKKTVAIMPWVLREERTFLTFNWKLFTENKVWKN